MAKSQIQLLTEAVEKLINHPVAPVLPVLPIAPVAPIAPIDNSITQDLIVKFTRLEENVKLNFQQVKDAIKELNDGTTSKIENHETRLNSLETSKTKQNTTMAIGIGILTILVSLLIYHLV